MRYQANFAGGRSRPIKRRMNTIRIAGKDYPCRMTMGAMLRFKQQMGYEVTAVKGESFTDTLTLLWCCVASACAREKIPFDLSPMEMADAITLEDFGAWKDANFEAVQADASPATDTKKKA